MLRKGRTGHIWHLVVDHIMLVMKIRSFSPVNRLVGLYRGFCVHVQKKKVAIYIRLSPEPGQSRLSMVIIKKLC